MLDHLALRMALAGTLTNVALVAGHADSAFAAKGSSREPNEARAREHLRAILSSTLPPAEVERLLADGAKMTESEACRLALED